MTAAAFVTRYGRPPFRVRLEVGGIPVTIQAFLAARRLRQGH